MELSRLFTELVCPSNVGEGNDALSAEAWIEEQTRIFERRRLKLAGINEEKLLGFFNKRRPQPLKIFLWSF